jgi:hypothetical protein
MSWCLVGSEMCIRDRAYADMSTEIGVPLSYSMVSLWASGRRRMKNIDHVNAFYTLKKQLEKSQ